MRLETNSFRKYDFDLDLNKGCLREWVGPS